VTVSEKSSQQNAAELRFGDWESGFRSLLILSVLAGSYRIEGKLNRK